MTTEPKYCNECTKTLCRYHAATDDLLDALKEVVGWADLPPDVVTQARAAISRAEGKETP